MHNAKLFDNIPPSTAAWRVYLRIELQLLAHRFSKEKFIVKLTQLTQELAL